MASSTVHTTQDSSHARRRTRSPPVQGTRSQDTSYKLLRHRATEADWWQWQSTPPRAPAPLLLPTCSRGRTIRRQTLLPLSPRHFGLFWRKCLGGAGPVAPSRRAASLSSPSPPPVAPKIDGTRASPLCFRAPPLDRPLPPPPPPPLPSPPRDLAAGIARHRTRWIDRRPGRAFRLPTAADTDDGGAGGPILPPTPALVGDRCFPPPAVIARDTHGELSVLGLLAVWLLDDEMRGDANVSLFFRSVRCRYAPCGRGVLRGHWGCHAGLLVSLLALGLERNVRFLCSRSWAEFFVNDHFGSRGTDGRRVTRLV